MKIPVRPPLLAVATAALAAALCAPAASAALTVVDEAAYLGARVVDDKVRFVVTPADYDGTGAAPVPAEQALLHVPESARTTVPADPGFYEREQGPWYQFLGEQGDPIYTTADEPAVAQESGNLLVGQTGDQELWDANLGIDLELRSVSGPDGGKVYLYNDEGESYRHVIWDPVRDGVQGNVYTVDSEPGGRWPTTMSFTKPGVYCLDILPLSWSWDTFEIIERGVPAALAVAVGDVDTSTVAPCEQPPETDPPPPPPDPDAPFVFQAGMHIDLAARLGASGPLELGVRKSDAAGGGNVSWHDFDDSLVSLPDATIKSVFPSDTREDWSFVAPAGAPVYRSPVVGSWSPNAVWVGFGGEELDAPLSRGVTLRMTGVTAPGGGSPPGELIVYNGPSERGASTMFSTRQGLPLAVAIPPGSHRHANWDFTAPGVYCVGFDVDGARANGERLRDSGTLTFVVGSAIPPRSVRPCGRSGAPVPAGTHTPRPSEAPAGTPVELRTSTTDDAVPLGFARLTTELTAAGALRTRLVKGSPAGHGVAYSLDDVVFRVPEDDVAGRAVEYGGPSGREFSVAWGGDAPDHGVGVYVDAYGVEPQQLRGDVRWELIGVEGPGHFAIGSRATGVEQALFNTRPGHVRETYDLWPGRHELGPVWHFDAPGVYCVAMRWTATLASGKRVSDRHVLTFAAGEEPASVRPCAQAAQSGRIVLDAGHVDAFFGRPGTGERSGEVELLFKDGSVRPTEPVYRDLSDVTAHVKAGAKRALPRDPAYGFLGAPGDAVWILPQDQDQALLWPGWDAILSGALTGYRLRLDGVRGPGRFALFQGSWSGVPSLLLGSEPGQPKTLDFSGHAHASWAFTAAGVYCLDVTLGSLPPSGPSALRSDAGTLLVGVGGVDPARITEADCGSGVDGGPAPDPAPDPNPDPLPDPGPRPDPTLPGPQRPGPGGSGDPRQAVPATFGRVGRLQQLGSGRGRTAVLARLACRSNAACRLSVPGHVRITIAGRRFAVAVLAPRRIAAGRNAVIRVRLSRRAVARLAGRRTTVRVPIVVIGGGDRVRRTARISIERRAPEGAASAGR